MPLHPRSLLALGILALALLLTLGTGCATIQTITPAPTPTPESTPAPTSTTAAPLCRRPLRLLSQQPPPNQRTASCQHTPLTQRQRRGPLLRRFLRQQPRLNQRTLPCQRTRQSRGPRPRPIRRQRRGPLPRQPQRQRRGPLPRQPQRQRRDPLPRLPGWLLSTTGWTKISGSVLILQRRVLLQGNSWADFEAGNERVRVSHDERSVAEEEDLGVFSHNASL